MEGIRRTIRQIASTPRSQRRSNLSYLQLSIIPLLSLISSIYSLTLRFRHQLYQFNFLSSHRFPVPVISVGNITWGGNGKTPMVEFLARYFADVGISSLILTRGYGPYGGGDEARMLQRKLSGVSTRVGVGANRVATASKLLDHYGYETFPTISKKMFSEEKTIKHCESDRIGLAILDDGMQHFCVKRNLEILMVNSLMPWGNRQLLPAGPLREPLGAISRADIIVIHHADLVAENDIVAVESEILEVKGSADFFLTKMAPMHFFAIPDVSCKIPLRVVNNVVVLCVSGIGLADSFVRTIEKMGASYVDHIDFSDHHCFHLEELLLIRERLIIVETRFGSKPVVVITEKDYDRSPEAFQYLKPYEVLVLCSALQFLEDSEGRFKQCVLKHLLQRNNSHQSNKIPQPR